MARFFKAVLAPNDA